jgi:hypothetical protein
MTKSQLLLRTFGWAAVGFLVTNGMVVALGASFEAGNYDWKPTALSVIAAILAGIIAVLQSLKFSATTPMGKALNQFVQMFVAGLLTLAVADLTTAAAVAFAGAVGKLAIAALIGAVQAYLVNLPAPSGAQG